MAVREQSGFQLPCEIPLALLNNILYIRSALADPLSNRGQAAAQGPCTIPPKTYSARATRPCIATDLLCLRSLRCLLLNFPAITRLYTAIHASQHHLTLLNTAGHRPRPTASACSAYFAVHKSSRQGFARSRKPAQAKPSYASLHLVTALTMPFPHPPALLLRPHPTPKFSLLAFSAPLRCPCRSLQQDCTAPV